MSRDAKPRQSRAEKRRSGAVPERAPAQDGSRSPADELGPAAGEVRDLFGDFSEQTGAHFG